MSIEECVKRKVIPKEGDVLIICDERYHVVDSHQDPGRSDYCDKCHLNGKQINNRECIYSFLEGVYESCAEFIEKPYLFKRVRKKFKGL